MSERHSEPSTRATEPGCIHFDYQYTTKIAPHLNGPEEAALQQAELLVQDQCGEFVGGGTCYYRLSSPGAVACRFEVAQDKAIGDLLGKDFTDSRFTAIVSDFDEPPQTEQ
jgi:hypothetical protein